MTKWFLASFLLVLGTALAVPEAEARRFGGARSLGVQRAVPKAPPAAVPAKPAQQQQAAPAAGAQQAAPAAGSRWAPMLGGLALGGMLGYLFAGNGLGGLLLIALLAFAAVMAFRILARRTSEPAPQRMQYAGLARETVTSAPSAPQSAAQSSPLSSPVPASQGTRALGLDEQAFLKAAKTNFLKLQLANEAGQWDDIREFTTDELFAALREDASAAGEQTEVVALDAELVEVAKEGDKHWASVRFSGQVREAPAREATPFTEVWHLVKPVDGTSGWLLAGIQQMH